MDFVRLTEEQRQTFDRDGYLIVPQAIDGQAIEGLIEEGDRLMASFEHDGYYAHRRTGLVQEPAFAKLATNSSTVSLIVQLLGPNIHITNTALIYKHPQSSMTSEPRNWHRDVGVHLDVGHQICPRVGLKVGYCLTDFTEPNSGATLFVRESNNLAEPLAIPAGQIDPPAYDEPMLRAGDAFLFESRIYHAPALNFTNRIAKVVIYGYRYRWIKPDYYLRYHNDRLQPDDALTEKLDDIGRQLLGATVDTQGRRDLNGLHVPLQEWAEKQDLPKENYPQVVTA
ncbi:MAG: phytanoyl-CoA dioxygenase family protein [Candidatus Poribacteria bacterium]